MRCIIILLCVFGVAVCQPLSPDQDAALRSFVESIMECRDVFGATISLVRGGNVAFADGFGFQNIEENIPMTSTSRISIGSLSKAFTSTVAADVVSRNLIGWDTPLRDVLGEEWGMQGEFRSEEISLRDLLAHKVGLPGYWGVTTAMFNISREDIVMKRIPHFPVLRNFRESFLYSNYLYLIASYVTEVLDGRSWEEHIRELLLEPLDMTDTKSASEMGPEDWSQNAYSYTEFGEEWERNMEEEQLPFLAETDPAGGVWSTGEDMAKWINFHLNGGKTPEGEDLVPGSALQATYDGSSIIGPNNPNIRRPVYPVEDSALVYGMGWTKGTYRGYEQILHGGSYSSYSCNLSLLPEMDSGVWVCVNSPGGAGGATVVRLLTLFALDLLLDEDPWLDDETGCTFPAPWESIDVQDIPHQVTDPSKSLPERKALEEYVGDYGHLAFGIFSVMFNEDESGLRYRFGGLLQGDLIQSEDSDRFFMRVEPPLHYQHTYYPFFPIGFPLLFGGDGEVIFTVRVPYLEFTLPPVFEKGVVPE